MTTFLDRLAAFDVDYEIENCLNLSPRKSSSDSKSKSSDSGSKKRKYDGAFNSPIEIDDEIFSDHSLEMDLSPEQSEESSSESSSKASVKPSEVEEPPKKKPRLSLSLPKNPAPDANEIEKPRSTMTTTVTTPTAIITISSPSHGNSSPVTIKNEPEVPAQVDRDEIEPEEDKNQTVPEPIQAVEAKSEATNNDMPPMRKGSGVVRTSVKVAAWIAWSGLFFALGSLSDPNTVTSLFK